jgi:hypothetical protein
MKCRSKRAPIFAIVTDSQLFHSFRIDKKGKVQSIQTPTFVPSEVTDVDAPTPGLEELLRSLF